MFVSPARAQVLSLLFAAATLAFGARAQAQTPNDVPNGSPPTGAAEPITTASPAPVTAAPPPASAAPPVVAPPPAAPAVAAPAASPDLAPPPGTDTPRNPRPNEPPPAKFNEGAKFQIESADKQHKLEFHALLDADGRWFLIDKNGVSTFLIRRARPSLDARVFRYFDLTLQPEFAGSKFQILDAWGNIHLWHEFQLRAGKMKPPVGLERLQSSRDTFFPETALPSQLVPNRDVGAQLHGNIGNGTLEWAIGVFNGVPNGVVGEQDANDSKDTEGRIFVQPFLPTNIPALRSLGLGVAGTIGNQLGAPVQYQTAGQVTFFSYASNTTAVGKRTLVTPQAYYYAGPVGAMFEFVRVNEHWTNQNGASGTVGTTAWQVTLAAAIGGEETWRGVQVAHPLDPKKGYFGAFELGGRYGDLRVGDLAFDRGFANRNTSAQRATQAGVVGTWHMATWNHLRIAYEHTSFRGGAPGGGNRRGESLLDTRIQFAF